MGLVQIGLIQIGLIQTSKHLGLKISYYNLILGSCKLSAIFSFADNRRPGCEAHSSKNSAECKVVQRSCSFHLLFEVQIQILNCIQRACHELSKFISFFAEGVFLILPCQSSWI